MLNVYSLLRKQHVKCCPPADRLDCRISIKMDSQPCGGTIANTVRVFTANSIHTGRIECLNEYNYMLSYFMSN